MPQQPVSAPRKRIGDEPDTRWRLALLVAAAMGVAGYSALLSWRALAVDGMTVLEWAVLALLAANLAWVSLAGATALAGSIIIAARRTPPVAGSRAPLETDSLTAILFPIRNEDPARVTAAAQAMHDSLARAGAADAFEFFFLSDTNDDAIAAEEERAILRLRASRPSAVVFYRRRLSNIGRKAGNVADFVERWGKRYDYMAVMDADSLMSGKALTELVARLDEAPRTALIQTIPMLVNAQTMIARAQQFAMRAYGPIFGEGLAWWSGGAGNFWGHNAIIRVSAFAAHAGLPSLPGRGPLGGQILSHDFIEAALLRRGGWRVEIAPDISGSFEESPPTLEDLAARDRRWAQGNLQHLRLVTAKGLDAANRAHLLAGIMGYGSSLMWFALIVTGALQAWASAIGLHESGAPDMSLLFLTALIILSPKWLSLMLWSIGRLPGWSRHHRFITALATETVISAVTAPIMMVNQALAVAAPFFGADAGWRPQARVVTRSASVTQYQPHMFVGLLLCATMAVSPGFAAWTMPVAASLVFAAPLAASLACTPRRRTWLWLVLATPEDLRPPAILVAARRATAELGWIGRARASTPAAVLSSQSASTADVPVAI